MDTELETYRHLSERACAFERSLLTRQCDCARAERWYLAEHEGIRCSAAAARQRCLAVREQLRAQARFVLKTADLRAALPHAQGLRVQLGGLRGLHAALYPATPPPSILPDLDGLISAALARFGTVDALPFGTIVRHIAACTGRRARRRA